jgi:hypothetical protein
VNISQALGEYTRVVNDFSLFPAGLNEGKAGDFWYHEDTQAYFDDADHYKMIRAMCRLSCSVCDNAEDQVALAAQAKRKSKFRSIDQLKGHLFHAHRVHMCNLCLEGRKVKYFSNCTCILLHIMNCRYILKWKMLILYTVLLLYVMSWTYFVMLYFVYSFEISFSDISTNWRQSKCRNYFLSEFLRHQTFLFFTVNMVESWGQETIGCCIAQSFIFHYLVLASLMQMQLYC